MSKHSSPGGLKPSTLPLRYRGSPQYWIFTSERGRNIGSVVSSAYVIILKYVLADAISFIYYEKQKGTWNWSLSIYLINS